MHSRGEHLDLFDRLLAEFWFIRTTQQGPQQDDTMFTYRLSLRRIQCYIFYSSFCVRSEMRHLWSGLGFEEGPPFQLHK
jgi:hypothetical protein